MLSSYITEILRMPESIKKNDTRKLKELHKTKDGLLNQTVHNFHCVLKVQNMIQKNLNWP